jgi:hypothetical protein
MNMIPTTRERALSLFPWLTVIISYLVKFLSVFFSEWWRSCSEDYLFASVSLATQMIPLPTLCDVREIHSVLRPWEDITSKRFQNRINIWRLDGQHKLNIVICISMPEIQLTGKLYSDTFINFVLMLIYSWCFHKNKLLTTCLWW